MANLLSVGNKVAVYDAPDCKREGVVIAVNSPEDKPGKIIGVRLNDQHPLAHECDGLCPKGFGWWTLPENCGLLE